MSNNWTILFALRPLMSMVRKDNACNTQEHRIHMQRVLKRKRPKLVNCLCVLRYEHASKINSKTKTLAWQNANHRL